MCTAVVAALRGAWSPCGLSMLSALNPVSERARGHRYAATAGWYVLGAALGGAALGGVCAAVTIPLAALPAGRWPWVVAAVAGVIAAASDIPATRFALPTNARQVDERWLTAYRRWIYAAGFGVQIGTGFATYIMTAAVYLTAALACLTVDASQALAVGVVFGAIRGLAILTTVRVRTPDQLRRLVAAVDRLGRPSALLAAAACWVATAVAVGHLADGWAAVVVLGVGLTFMSTAPIDGRRLPVAG